MKSVHKYTLICFLLAAVFILGSMAGMNLILREKESWLLQENGTAQIESPVAIWQEPEEPGDEETEAAEPEEKRLTIEQMEEVISYRADAWEELLHDPVTGQISMEEAIASGENWLVEMGFVEENDSEVLARRASLGVKIDQEISGVPMEPYYSFWTVRFSSKFMYAVLWVNAVTGKVWDAEITLYDKISQGFSWEKLELFLELAGVQEDTENFVEINETNTGALLRIKNSRLCAETKFYDFQVVNNNNHNDGNISWNVDDKYRIKVETADEVVEHNENEDACTQRIIVYRLISSG